MRYKIGGGNRLQPYKEENGRYMAVDERSGKDDLDRLIDVFLYPPTNDTNKTIGFPQPNIHSKEYYEMFVYFVKSYHLYGKPTMADSKIHNYLFIHKAKDDKSKFMIDVLGFSNTHEGREKARRRIIEGTNLKTMVLGNKIGPFLLVVAQTEIYDKNGKIHHMESVWRINEDFSVSFVTLLPKEAKNGKN